MISFALFSALATFYFTMFFTPGPNNAMLTASGMKFGFVRTLPHLIGIPLGHIFQIGLTCFGLANLFSIYPQIQFYMKQGNLFVWTGRADESGCKCLIALQPRSSSGTPAEHARNDRKVETSSGPLQEPMRTRATTNATKNGCMHNPDLSV